MSRSMLPLLFTGLALLAQPLPEAARTLDASVQALASRRGLAAEVAREAALRRLGRVEEADALLGVLLGLHPTAPSVLEAQVQALRRSHRLTEAQATVQRLKKLHPQIRWRPLEVALAMDTMDFGRARRLLEARLRRTPKDLDAREDLGEVAYWEDRMEEAAALLDQVLAQDRNRSRAWRLRALVHRARQENGAWASAARAAVAADPLDDEARVVLADVLMRGEQKPVEGHAEARLALRLNPWNRSAHVALGNGWSLRGAQASHTELTGEAHTGLTRALTEASAALDRGDTPAAVAASEQALTLDVRHPEARVLLGAAHLAQGRVEPALAQFGRALAADPDHGLAHYGMALGLLRRRDAANVQLRTAGARFAVADAPEPEGLRQVFPEYTSLDAELQKIIRLSVKPLARWLPLLQERQLTFHIFPFHRRLFEVPHHGELKGQRTFDGRIWDDVKGAGGAHASAGAEWQRDVKHLRFNVLAHEFAHQVHGQLPDDLKQEITALYAKGKAERRTLDFYSDANEMEYFAVGVEAYVSEAKLPDQKITYGHTRQALRQRDPALYAFIERLGKGPQPKVEGRLPGR